MELFEENGCLSDEGLQAVIHGQLDELGRLETAEHLAYCDKCMDRYTALLTADVLQDPPHPANKAVMATIWVQLMQNTWGRAAVASVAAVLALTMWRSGALDQILLASRQVHTWTPSTTQTEPERLGRPVNDTRPEPSNAPLGKPVEDEKPALLLAEKITNALDGLLGRSGADTAEK